MDTADILNSKGKAWISLAPFLAAALVAISRTMDYRRTCLSYHIHFFSPTHHSTRPDHWQDVLVGSTLGAVLAYFSYRQYYPSLASKNSHRPYSPRIKHTEILLPAHNLHTFGESHDDGNHVPYNDHSDALAETVPRPDTGPLENVWREGEDE
jgi:diacylglycerol diphosphate phosphatase/phosphatidate phosphatase